MLKAFIISAFAAMALSFHAGAKQEDVDLILCAQGKVDRLLAADVFVLDSGETIRLMMVQVPHIPSGTETGKPWPMAEEIRTATAKKIEGELFSFHCLKRSRNRHGEIVAMAKMASGAWLQSFMIEKGWARVYSTKDYAYTASDFYALEDKARADSKGMWSYDSYKLRGVTELNNNTGRFEVVEGTILNVATAKNITYMNFGEDWRARRLFKKAGIDPASFAGKYIQVRGWISWNGGPMIDLTHPAQIRLLGVSDQLKTPNSAGQP